MLWISDALAQDAVAGAPPGGLLGQLIPLALIVLVFYFLLIRPQQKRLKEHAAMVEAIRRGDTVVTAGGLVGTVSKVEDDQHIMVELAKDVKVKVVKSTISSVTSHNQPANDAGGSNKRKAS